MPICCHGRFLRFPSSLPPPFLLHSPPILSIYPRARYTRGTMDKLDKRYEEREEEKEEEERERRMATAYGVGALRTTWPTDLRKNVIVRIVQDVSLSFSSTSLLFSPCSATSFFSTTLFFIFLPRFYILVSDDPRIRSEKCDKHEEDKNELSSILHGSTVKYIFV